jgi:hypothetical protein
MPFVLKGHIHGNPVFWTGYRNVSGEPQWTLFISDAFKTNTSDELLAAVRTHPEINENEWKVKLWGDVR